MGSAWTAGWTARRGSRPKSQMPEILAESDVCLGVLLDIPMFRTTYPNKIFDYMAASRPVVGGAEKRNVAAAIVRPMNDARAKRRNIVDMADADENQSGVRDDFFHFPRCARLFRKSRL